MKLALLVIPFLFVGMVFAEEDFIFVDQQIQIVSDLENSQDREQSFAYIVQIKNNEEVTVSLAWITGSLSPNQRLSPALSWTPQSAGMYTAEIFVWQSITNPEPLSVPLELDFEVRDHEG